jgi:hypothetical protein
MIDFVRYSGYIDPLAAGEDPEVAHHNMDVMILCISNTGIFLLQSAVDIFVVSNSFVLIYQTSGQRMF